VRRFLRDLTISVCAAALLLMAQPYTLAAPPSTPHRAILSRVAPLYPVLARRMRVAGNVTIRAVVLPNGAVSDIQVESGHALLRQAAGDAVRLWRFAADSNSSECIVSVVFELPR
jgi:TonB family protein